MTKLSNTSTTYLPTAGEHLFADDMGRLWSAAPIGDALVFTCISEGRRQQRAIAVDRLAMDGSVTDDTLRAWLDQAPHLGTLP